MADARGASSKIEIRLLPARITATVRQEINRDDVTEALGRMYQAVGAAIAKQGIMANGAPFARYHDFGDRVDLEAGLPVPSPIQAEGNVKPSQLPAGPAAIAVHAGPYETLASTYDAIGSWIERTGRQASGGPWEIYLTDPSTEPEPARWLTEIIWPLKG
jgi:effector-binding domain-containing protein